MLERVTARAARAWRRRAARLLPDAWVVRRQYAKENGRAPNLARPRELSEKLCWLKLNYCTPLQEQCSDKLAVRDYVADRVGGGYLIPALAVLERAADLRPEAVGAPAFVAKATHDSNSVRICCDRESFDWEQARAFFRRRLRQNWFHEAREPTYRNITPRIMVEALLPSTPAQPLSEYSFWCFAGRVELIEVAQVRLVAGAGGGRAEVRQLFFGRDWTRRDVARQYPAIEGPVPRPEKLDEMVAVAERLTAPFPFCRADLYEAEGGVRFGELTFSPSASYVRFRPDAEERRLGDLLALPTPTRVPRGGRFGAWGGRGAPAARAVQSGTASRAKLAGS